MAKRKGKRPSMQDVADLAGVSTTTVSFVINDVPDTNISAETRERVQKAVRELGYRPNVMARTLRSNRSHAIGFISDEVATTPYAGQMIQGAQDAAWANEMILLLANTTRDPEMEQAAIDLMLDYQVDGIVYAAMYHRPVNPPDALFEVPVVLLDCYCENHSVSSVIPDEVQGGREATEVLLKKGHRRIGFINNENPIPATLGRLRGYKEALSAYDVPYDESLVCSGESVSQGGYQCALELMRLPDPPTALFCFNDRMAMGAYDALRKLGLSIPEDVAVMGFDDQEIIAAHLYPPLSTMGLPHREMGEWAVSHLTDLINSAEESQDPIQQRISCPYVERSSI